MNNLFLTDFPGFGVRLASEPGFFYFLASLSPLFPKQSVRDTFGGLLLVLFDDVGVEGLRGADVQVAKLLRDGNDVGTVGDQH